MLGTVENIDFPSLGVFVEAGFAIHWLHERDKRPVGEDWSTRPVATLDQLKRRHVTGYNVGVRTGEPSKLLGGGYVHIADVDIRDPACAAEAMAALTEMLPGIAHKAPTVISGSGGASRHYYFACEKAFRSKKLAHSETSKMVYDPAKRKNVNKWDWEIELFGTGKQVAMPPSIHPRSGRPYLWERPINLVELSLGLLPSIEAARLEKLGAIDQTKINEIICRSPPVGLSEDEVEGILARLLKCAPGEYCEDRAGWLKVGMALHHEFLGDERGWDLWKEFSEHSAKFDEKDQRIVWNSFRDKPNAVTMASLVAIADQMYVLELAEGFEDLDDEPERQSRPDTVDDGSVGCVSSAANDFDAAASTEADSSLGWVSLMEVSEKGKFSSTLHNVKLIVCNDPRLCGVPQRNLFTQDIHQRRQPGQNESRRKGQPAPVVQLEGPIWMVDDKVNGDIWVDDKDFAMRALIEAPRAQGGYGIKVSDRDLKAAIAIAANDHAFHPVREYLETLRWDGKPRIAGLFVDYLGAPLNPYTASVGRLMLIAAVTRIYEPGHKFDFATILEGLQGRRKSTFIRILGKSWASELDGDFHDPKSMVELMMSKWILELPELSGFARADVRAIKAFISRQTDRVRLAYARRAVDFRRQCILIGSTNDREYLKDDTGGRRFWPMPCNVQSIDTDRLLREVDQLWAEALASYREMRSAQPKGDLPLYLTDPEAQRIAADLQESRRVESVHDTWAARFRRWLNEPIDDGGIGGDFDAPAAPSRFRMKVTIDELWERCLDGKPAMLKTQERQQIGRAMTMLLPEWERKQVREHGERVWVYARRAPPVGAAVEDIIG